VISARANNISPKLKQPLMTPKERSTGVADAHRALLMRDGKHALQAARRVWNLKDKVGRRGSELSYRRERDEIRAEWMVGAALVASAGHDRAYEEPSLGEAELHLNRALECCRRINMVDHEATILIDLARLRGATGAPAEAQRLAEEALLITERSGYVLQGADVHLELAKLALARGDKASALDHAQEARRFATCDGPPDYTYKVAYDEAGALLAQALLEVADLLVGQPHFDVAV
jgi:tetratricopeptide (TPR) repeat protein